MENMEEKTHPKIEYKQEQMNPHVIKLITSQEKIQISIKHTLIILLSVI